MNKPAVASLLNREETTGPLTDAIYEQVLDAIYQGRLAPGSVVNEAALAQELGVSRGPVREAVRRLQGIQLVTREPYMKARVVTMSAEAVIELFELRMALEGMACFLATQRMGDEDIDELLVAFERHHRLQGEGADAGVRPFDLHERIARASGNGRIINALCGDLYHLLRIYRRHSGTVLERTSDAYPEHWQILRAMKSRDAALAESLMRAHIGRAAQHLSSHLETRRRESV